MVGFGSVHKKEGAVLNAPSFLFVEIIRVDLGIFFPLLRHFRLVEDGGHRTGRDAGAAIDARGRIDIEHRVFIVALDAIDGTHVDARLVLHSDARLADHVGHMKRILKGCTRDLPRAGGGAPSVEAAAHVARR